MNTMLTIAGSDSIGGAGIQADLKTSLACNVYGMSVITSVTAQNTVGVQSIFDIPQESIAQQIDSVFTDVFPDSVKIGMVSNSQTIETIAERLSHYQAKNVVCDTVMVSTSGKRLISEDAIDTLKAKLMPLADIVTPNIAEAEVLSGTTIRSKDSMVVAAKKVAEWYGGYILIKGGHLRNYASDLLYYKGNVMWYTNEKVDNPNTHGTGCTLSSAIASYLALGNTMERSVGLAKDYVTTAIKFGLDIGHGNGSLWHNVTVPPKPTKENVFVDEGVPIFGNK